MSASLNLPGRWSPPFLQDFDAQPSCTVPSHRDGRLPLAHRGRTWVRSHVTIMRTSELIRHDARVGGAAP